MRAPQPPYSSDPIVSFSDDGWCFVTALPYGGGTAGIQVATSTDGGITFSTGTQVTPNGSADKEWTWIDNFPSSPYYHRIYVAWMDFAGGSAVRLNYSTDRGATWSAQSTVASTAYQFPQPVVLPNGDVLVTYSPNGGQVGYRRSTDGGVTFGSLNAISSLTQPPCPPDDSGCFIWRLNAIPSAAVDSNTGDTVVTWADGRTGTAIVYYSRSTDNGATWSAAAQMAPPGAGSIYQVEPWVTTDETGVFHAVWYDDRDNPNTSIFNIYYSQSTDEGQTWSPAVRISTATSDLRIGIPSSYAGAAGDYINVTAAQGNVYAVWTDTREGTGEDIYAVRGTIPQGTPTPTVTGTPPTVTPTNTPVPPTATATATPVPPSATPSSTATPTVPTEPTQTATAPVGTATPALPTDTPAPSATAAPPTGTPAATTTSGPSATATPATPTETPCGLSFSDVHAPDYFYVPVQYLACHGVISGYADGTFRPYNSTTRAQMVKIVVLGFGHADRHARPAGGYTFADVPPSFPFFDVIETAAADNIVSGYDCGGPGEPCDAQNRPYFRPYNERDPRPAVQDRRRSRRAGPLHNPPTGTFADVLPGTAFYTFVETAVLPRHHLRLHLRRAGRALRPAEPPVLPPVQRRARAARSPRSSTWPSRTPRPAPRRRRPNSRGAAHTRKRGCRTIRHPRPVAARGAATAGPRLFLPEVPDVLIDVVREAELVVDVTAAQVVRRGADGEVLLLLPLQDALAAGRVVVVRLHLQHERARPFLVHVGLLAQQIDQFLFLQEVPGNHDEGEAAVSGRCRCPARARRAGGPSWASRAGRCCGCRRRPERDCFGS